MNKSIFFISAIFVPTHLLQSKIPDLNTRYGSEHAKKAVYGKPEDVVQNLNSVVSQEPVLKVNKNQEEGQFTNENTSRFSMASNSSSANRFNKIKLDAQAAANEIDFWGRQMSEHALFSYLGLEDPDLKQSAYETHLEFENFRKKFNTTPKNVELMNQILPLLKKQRDFQIKVLNKLNDGNWLGWTYPAFVNHITLELDYFVDKLNGIAYTPEQELAFWNRINSEHAALDAHLLDPSEQKLCKQAKDISDKFFTIPKNEKEMMVQLSLKYTEELDKFNRDAKAKGKKAIKSLIHPVLLQHDIREGERAIKTLKSLGLHKEGSKLAQQQKKKAAEYRQ